MPEQATKDEIARVVLTCCEPITLVPEPVEVDFAFAGGATTTIAPRRFTAVEGRPDADQETYVVRPARLAKALGEMKFERPSEGEAVERLRAPAVRLRSDLARKIEDSWEHEYSALEQVAALDAFIAGLDLRVPAMLQSEFARVTERLVKEADPKWSEYQQLHAQFDGEHPG